MSKFNLLNGYWQVPLSECAKEILAFGIPDRLFHYTVMPFGIWNAPATFLHMINRIILGLEQCASYIIDDVVYSHSWEQHVDQLHCLFS